MIRVALADSHKLFRKSIEMLLHSFGNVEVVFDTDSISELSEALKKKPVDLVIMDCQMQKTDGVAGCKVLKMQYPDIRFLILTQSVSKELILEMIDIGMDGFFSKNSDPYQLQKAIQNLNARGFHFDSELEMMISDALLWEKKNAKSKPAKKTVSITRREMDIIRLACQELSSIEIAENLHINVRTVESHRKRMIAKTNTKNFIGVILYALRNQLLVLDSVY